MAAIKRKELLEALKRIRDLREWSAREKVNPWAVRQALIIGLEMDSIAAHEHGVTPRDLSRFDDQARGSAHRYIRGIQTTIGEKR